MDLRQTAVLMLAVGALLVSVRSQAVCRSGWFGSLCQYKCRCSDNYCTTEGACRPGVLCQGGWFGPACQYVDLAYSRSSAWETTDGDDQTCVAASRPKQVTVILNHRYHVTWLRVRLSKPDLQYNLTVRFRRDASLSCTNTRTARVDNTTLDIHCDLKETVDRVILSGEGVRHLCSVYISGGRNVAVKQNSSQSSTYPDNPSSSFSYPSQYAVDGNTDPVFLRGNTCSHTFPGDSNPNLNISFSTLHRVTRYVLYNRVDGDLSYRLKGFELRSYGPSMTPVFNYTDTSQDAQLVYTVVPNQVTPPIRLVNVAVNNSDRILTLCELEVYGDSACQPGQYGRECEHTCHCAGDQSCFVSTGACPSGCAAGFMGQDCRRGCSPGWFGSLCQYKCRCSDSNCTTKGACGSGVPCQGGWFGPACQYADLAYKRSSAWETTDGDDTTCLDASHSTKVNITLDHQYHVTWLRVRFSKPDLLYNLTVRFREDASLSCTNTRTARVDNTTLDIYCDLNETVKHVVLSGEGLHHLCSVHISGGRNVALKQNTSQSSTYLGRLRSYPSQKAVDGNSNPVFKRGNTCSHTATGDSNPNLNVSFSTLQHVTRYVLYNRDEGFRYRLQGFELRSFGPSMTPVFNYTDTSQHAQPVYTVVPDQVTPPILLVNVAVNNSDRILTLCELEVYGDSVCDPGQYGRECEHTCHCAGDQSCFVNTGGCPSGCPAGFMGQDCRTGCNVGSYGPGCQLPCSQFCVRDGDPGAHFCDTTNGTCLRGCQSGYLGSNCRQSCDPGRYGPQCESFCSQFCVRDNDRRQHFCDNINGTCLHGCQSGYQGSTCAKSCDVGSYGPECQLACSQFCVRDRNPRVHFCYHTNGTCLHGCQSGYLGSNCTERCDVGSYGPGCQLACSQFCVRYGDPGAHFCDNTNGTCLNGCRSGYLGSNCSERCDVGSYGTRCQLTCSQFCVRDGDPGSHFCEHTNGGCLHGCQSGYQGSNCTEKLPVNVAAVAVPMVGGVGVLVLVVLAVVFCRRQTMSKHGPTLNANNDVDESHFNDVNSSTAGAVAASRHHTVQQAATTQEAETRRKGSGDDSNEVYQNVSYGNASTVVSIDDLADFIKSTDIEFFKNQFCVIAGNQEATMTVGQSPENKDKNRYKNICPYDHSRVHLLVNKDKNQGDYINASFIQGYRNDEKFIASHGPTKTTLPDFLRMLWEQEVDTVVMLTSLIEDGKQKCERYWPEDGHMKVGEMTVRLATTQVFSDYTIRRLQLKKESEALRNLIQFHFTAWPDKDIPTVPWGLVDFEQRVVSYPTNKPIVVHCSAGVGRTGTFIALRNVMREAEETGHMDFFTAVRKLRQDRINMVQTVDQYIFLHRAALVAILCSGTSLTLADVDNHMQALAAKSKSGVTELEHEFQMICCVSEEQTEEDTSEDSPSPVYENNQSVVIRQKNRAQSVISKEMYRAVLSCDTSDTSDYINAVLVPSFLTQDQEILTQLPLPTTISDLWRLVTQYKVGLMVAFETDTRATDQTVGDYLPSGDDGPTVVGAFTLRTETDTSTTLWKQEKIYITQDADGDSTAGKPWRVTHLTCTTNLDPASLLEVTQHVRSQKSTDHGRTLYMCRNGAEYSGLVYVLTLLLDRLDNDHQLTVPLVVGAVKAVRPQVIPTLDQYRLLYQALQLYGHSMNEYSNFTQ